VNFLNYFRQLLYLLTGIAGEQHPVFCARTFQGLHSVRLWTPTFLFFRIFFEEFFLGVLDQAVLAVSKNRPKHPMLDIPFQAFYTCHPGRNAL
jgi:hypothetical protein